MKKINKKGFTLIELLGVIVILILILSLVLPKIIGRTKSKNEVVTALKDEIVIKAAKLYLDEAVEPKNGNTYCIDIDNLVRQDYLLEDSNYEGKYVTATYNDGYSYSISSTCIASSTSSDRCESEGLCTACYVSRTYNNEVYLYDAEVIHGISNENSELFGSNITYVQNEIECLKSAAISAAKDYYNKYTYMFKKRVGNVYCLSLSTLLSQNRINGSLYDSLNGQGYTSVRISYNSSTSSFDYEVVSTCTPNVQAICTAISNDEYGRSPTTNFLPGETYDCAVNSSNTYRFYLLSSNEQSVTLVTKDALSSGIWCNLVGGLSDPQTTKGPDLAISMLQSLTSSWTYIDSIMIGYTDESRYYAGNTNATRGGYYGGIKTTIDSSGNYITNIYQNDNTVTATYTNLKARLMTYEEMYNNGCSYTPPTNIKSAVNKCTTTSYCDDINWINASSTWLLDSFTSFNALNYQNYIQSGKHHCIIRNDQVNTTSYVGYRPVIDVSKYDLSINSGNY